MGNDIERNNLKKEKEEFDDERTSLEEALKSLRKEVAAKTDKCNAIKLKMLVQEKQQAQLRKQAEEKDGEISKLTEANSRLEEEMTALSVKLASEGDGQINSQRLANLENRE